MLKKIIISFLALIMAFSMTVVALAKPDDLKVTNISVDGNIVTASVTGGEKVCFMVYKDFNIVYQGEAKIAGANANLNIPAHALKRGSYKISAWCVDGERQGDVTTFTVSLGSGSGDISFGATKQNPLFYSGILGELNISTPVYSRSVMIPYASVYSDTSMSREIAQLTRHQFVEIEWYNSGIAKVHYDIQSGKGTTSVVDDINAEYTAEGDLQGTGYMYMSAFAQPIVATESDGEREVVELAYSRLGTKGVYSQAKRYQSVYLDCSSLCAWAYYQIGYKIYNGGSNCNAIANFMEDHPDAVVWQAEYQRPACIPEAATEIAFWSDAYNISDAEGRTAAVEVVETFPNDINKIKSLLKPGDIIMFNWEADVRYSFIDKSGRLIEGEDKLMVVQETQDLETALEKYGYDHAAIYIGEGKIIEASGPQTNTISSELIECAPYVVAVYRPLSDETLKMTT